MKSILVTGATGFVGKRLCAFLVANGWKVRAAILSAKKRKNLPRGVEAVEVPAMDSHTDWSNVLSGISMVIHLAARVHIMDDCKGDQLDEYRKVNVAGTERLAREAVRAGVKRIVYVSSVKVLGEESDHPYSDRSPASPCDPYGISKWEAEQILAGISLETGLEVVVVRPPIVYGPGVKANFFSLLRAIDCRIPLPVASATCKRSMIYLDNLVDVLVVCATHSNAVGKTYLVSDGEDISIPDLVRRIASTFGKTAMLFPVPVSFVRFIGALLGLDALVRRLFGSLTVDISGIRYDLDWDPPYTMEYGLRETVKWFRNESHDSITEDGK